MSTLIEIAAIAAVALVVVVVMNVIHRRKERRKNIRFFQTLDMIQNADGYDELIAIRDDYREELGNPLNL